MKVITPEIAWHETLPIYSCDLQPLSSSSSSSNRQNPRTPREPLNEIPVSELMPSTLDECDDVAATKTQAKKENVCDDESSWTRLATAGGDNAVRLWRVYLDWTPPSSVTVTTFKKPLPKGMLASSEKKRASGAGAGSGGVKVSAAVSEGLVFLASLKRHERLVNVVRWSPSGKFLASAGDDQFVIIWSLQEQEPTQVALPPSLVDEDTDQLKSTETWIPFRSLRRHLEDIYDLCWAPDERGLISGSVDQSTIIWHLDLSQESSSGPKALVQRDHKHYVQGVAWDPQGVFVVSMSSDRTCRVYKISPKPVCVVNIFRVEKQHLFQDDSWKSFFRRPAFSPDGLLLACPAGNLESAVFAGDMASAVASATSATSTSTSISSKVDAVNSNVSITSAVAPQHAAHIFLRGQFNKGPCLSLPTGPRPVIAVRFCPQPFQLRMSNPQPGVACTSLFRLPYRWLFCLVLEDGLLFFDTQQAHPFAQVSQIHYQALNDAAWSSDGRLVSVTSTDGYCSLVHFSIEELGAPYRGPLGACVASAPPPPPAQKSVDPPQAPVHPPPVHPLHQATAIAGDDEAALVAAASESNGVGPEPIEIDEDELRPSEKPSSTEDEGSAALTKPRHISFQACADGVTPDRTLPATPNTGRHLSAPLPTPSDTPISSGGKVKRRVSFITLPRDSEVGSSGCDGMAKPKNDEL